VKRIMPFAILAAVFSLTHAGYPVTCTQPDGSVVYTDKGCGKTSKRRHVDSDSPPSGSGLRQGEKRMLRQIEAKERVDLQSKRRAREIERRRHLGYGDRQRIKQLRSERARIKKQIDRRDLGYSQSKALRKQLDSVDREMARIQAPKW